MLARHRLGLGQAHRDLGDRARRLPQLAQPARERGEGEHEDDRAQRRQQEQRRLGPQQEVDWPRRGRGPQRDIGVERADPRPYERSNQREYEGRPARRTRIHGLQHGADVLTIVVRRRSRGKRRFRFVLGRPGREPPAKERRRVAGGRSGLQDRRCGRRLRRGELRRRGAVVRDKGGNVIVRQVQRAFDRRHRRRNGIRRRILFCQSSASLRRRRSVE